MTTSSLEVSRLVDPPVKAEVLINHAMELLVRAVGSLDETSFLTSARPTALRNPGDALLELVAGSCEADAVELGVPVIGSRLTVVCCESTRILDALRQQVELPRRVVQVPTTASEWLLLIPGLPGPAREDAAARDTKRVLAALCRTAVGGWHAGVSASLRHVGEMPGAFRDARDLAALAARERRRSLAVDQAWAQLTVARLHDSARAALPSASPLDVLDGYDRENSTDLRETIAIWLNATGDVQAAAKALCIHVNTLRYRLRRAATVANIDLQDPHQRLVLQLTSRPEPR